jgi:O-antigen/teichoic acid export membrane protein
VIVLRADGYVVAAGIFTVITGIAGQMTGLLDSALGPLTAIAAGVVAVDPDRGKRMFARSFAVSSTLGAFFVCVFVPVAILFLNVFYAKQYSSATAEFGALALVSGTQTVLGPLNAFAFATRSAAQLLRVNLLCLFFDAAVAFGAIPLLGLWGAVAANAGAQALSLLALVRLVSRRLDYSQRSIILQCRLFGLSVIVSAAEIAGCILIRERALLLMPFIGGLGVIALRFVTWKWPVLAISPEDFAQLGQMSASRKMAGAMRVLKWIGAVA